MKFNQKNAGAYCKSTRFIVITFKADGSRDTHYGGLNPLAALSFISSTLQSGQRALVFPDGFKYRDVYKPEAGVLESSACSQKDPNFYEIVRPYSIKTENFN